MNQRKAKRYRRAAERATVGKPNLRYTGYLEGPRRLFDCTRELYQKIKKLERLAH